MTILYHEKQESALCGQHCLNNLLQGPYFNAGALAEIALELDSKEKALMMTEGMTADAQAFLREASGNVDEQGNFSIQVLSEALKRSFGLELADVRHEEVRPLMREPAKAEGFVINRHAHWLGLGFELGLGLRLGLGLGLGLAHPLPHPQQARALAVPAQARRAVVADQLDRGGARAR